LAKKKEELEEETRKQEEETRRQREEIEAIKRRTAEDEAEKEKLVMSRCKLNITGLKIATHWSPMRPKIEHWRLNFQNWSPAGDSIAFRPITKENHDTTFVFKSLY